MSAPWVAAALVGFGTGILSAWGVGGGTLLLLCMTLFLGMEPEAARGINLVYFLPTAGLALLQHRKSGYLDGAVCRRAIPAGLLCALAGAWASAQVEVGLLRRGFGLFLLWAGIRLLTETKRRPGPHGPSRRRNA